MVGGRGRIGTGVVACAPRCSRTTQTTRANQQVVSPRTGTQVGVRDRSGSVTASSRPGAPPRQSRPRARRRRDAGNPQAGHVPGPTTERSNHNAHQIPKQDKDTQPPSSPSNSATHRIGPTCSPTESPRRLRIPATAWTGGEIATRPAPAASEPSCPERPRQVMSAIATPGQGRDTRPRSTRSVIRARHRATEQRGPRRC